MSDTPESVDASMCASLAADADAAPAAAPEGMFPQVFRRHPFKNGVVRMFRNLGVLDLNVQKLRDVCVPDFGKRSDLKEFWLLVHLFADQVRCTPPGPDTFRMSTSDAFDAMNMVVSTMGENLKTYKEVDAWLKGILKDTPGATGIMSHDDAKSLYDVEKTPATYSWGPGYLLVVTSKKNPKEVWFVEVKLDDLTEDMVWQIATLCPHFPPGQTVSIQVDAHVAGQVMIGMVASCGNQVIPFQVISADIGCGILLLPLVDGEGTHMSVKDMTPQRQGLLRVQHLRACRGGLARGRDADDGKASKALRYLAKAFSFLGKQGDVQAHLLSIYEMVRDLHIPVPGVAGKENHQVFNDLVAGPLHGLPHAKDVAKAAIFAYKFAASLGNSGNHFAEMQSSAKTGKLYVAVHSGSRGFGGKVYKILFHLSVLAGTPGVMHGAQLAGLYGRYYTVLSEFASINRIICAMIVLEGMGLSTDPVVLRTVVSESPDVARVLQVAEDHARGRTANPEDVPMEVEKARTQTLDNLVMGMIHNGLKAFIAWDESGKVTKILVVALKGAICVSRAASLVIIALKAGDGIFVKHLGDPTVRCKEVTIPEAERWVAQGVPFETSLENWKNEVFLAGHGAGRTGPADETARSHTWDELVSGAKRRGYGLNVGLSVLGDHPEGYKNSEEVLLRLEGAGKQEQFITECCYKEGTAYKPNQVEKFKRFLRECLQMLPGKPSQFVWACIDWGVVQFLLDPSERERGGQLHRDALRSYFDDAGVPTPQDLLEPEGPEDMAGA